MRISDWSSDVCSSDLIGAAVYPLILSATIVLLALHGMIFGQSGPIAELDRRPFLAIVTAVLLFALVVERLGLVPAVVLCMVAAYAAQVRRRYVFFAVYARSEEHTSELQSLMRTSFACSSLKKTNITI